MYRIDDVVPPTLVPGQFGPLNEKQKDDFRSSDSTFLKSGFLIVLGNFAGSPTQISSKIYPSLYNPPFESKSSSIRSEKQISAPEIPPLKVWISDRSREFYGISSL